MHTIAPGTRWQRRATRDRVTVEVTWPESIGIRQRGRGLYFLSPARFLARYEPAPTVWQRLQAWAHGACR